MMMSRIDQRTTVGMLLASVTAAVLPGEVSRGGHLQRALITSSALLRELFFHRIFFLYTTDIGR